MSDSQVNAAELKDPCAEFGPAQRNAILWFLFIIIGFGIVVSQLARLDSWMYVNDAETLDYDKYRENRTAQSTVPSEGMDIRANGTFPSSSTNSLTTGSK